MGLAIYLQHSKDWQETASKIDSLIESEGLNISELDDAELGITQICFESKILPDHPLKVGLIKSNYGYNSLNNLLDRFLNQSLSAILTQDSADDIHNFYFSVDWYEASQRVQDCIKHLGLLYVDPTLGRDELDHCYSSLLVIKETIDYVINSDMDVEEYWLHWST